MFLCVNCDRVGTVKMVGGLCVTCFEVETQAYRKPEEELYGKFLEWERAKAKAEVEADNERERLAAEREFEFWTAHQSGYEAGVKAERKRIIRIVEEDL